MQCNLFECPPKEGIISMCTQESGEPGFLAHQLQREWLQTNHQLVPQGHPSSGKSMNSTTPVSVKSKTTPALKVTVVPHAEVDQLDPDKGELTQKELAQQMAKLHPPEKGIIVPKPEPQDDIVSHMSKQNSHDEP